MGICPITGVPCSNPKIIHVTDVGAGYSAEKSFDLCQVCGEVKLKKAEPKPPPISAVKNFFDLLSIILTAKTKQTHVPKPQSKPPCPGCGTTINDIEKTSRLGCPQCYEYYKTELLPVIIHVHKSTEHVGKRPKHKGPVLENLPVAEQISLLELQMKQAAEQEQYEKAKELKDKLASLMQKPEPGEPTLDD